MVKCTKQQIAFITEYIKNGNNATKAAVSAGYSEKSAVVQGSMLLKKPHIMQKIAEVKQQIAEEIDIDVEWLKEQLIINVKSARKAGKYADSNAAIKMIGELIGEFQKEKTDGITVNVLELLGNIEKPALPEPVIEVEG